MKNLFVYLPCYNEEENIGALIEKWLGQEENLKELGYKLIVTVIDDKSTDGTGVTAERYAKEYPCVFLFTHKKNRNLGGGLRSAFALFLRNGKEGDLCALMDGDNTHDPKIRRLRQGKSP